MRYVTRPLTPDARTRLKGVQRTGSPFNSTWTSTLRLLDQELRHLGVRNEFILQIDCTESDLRLDGQLRANARVASPAVAISIERRNAAPLLFVCGRFPTWQDNVRAIALGLEALRKVERYGIVQAAEQYTGFQALPPGTPMPAAKMTEREAALLLLDGDDQAGVADVIGSASVRDTLYRAAAKRHHPDAGGDPALFRRLTEARDLLAAQG